MTRVLYISYDGMTDPLGQSQVIPYLKGLSKLGYSFTLISFEKKDRYEKYKNEIASLLESHNIEWVPLSYTKSPPVISTLWDVWRMSREAFTLHALKNFKIVHCRSYISAIVGLRLKRKTGLKFLFDMRGFYADERVEGGIWNLKNPAFRLIYNFFKKKQLDFFSNADYPISLTNNGKKEIQSWKNIKNQSIPIEVIPCCADLDKFNRNNVNEEALQNLRNQMGLKSDTFVLSYLGSIGTWYMPDEMLDFFKVLIKKIPDARFLFVTGDDPNDIKSAARKKGIPVEQIIVASTKHAEVPLYLSLSSWSIFFIKPVFSKKASSPTKQGEIMGMSIPHICNKGVGDVGEIINDVKLGICLSSFNEESYDHAVNSILEKTTESAAIRNKACEQYSLENGVKKYNSVYQKILSD